MRLVVGGFDDAAHNDHHARHDLARAEPRDS
jgi:hypothetical protein